MFTLLNNREEIKDISSFVWRKVLDKEKIMLRCPAELYEGYYKLAAFDSFTVILASAEVINTLH
ncbi:hypothetical protein [Wolbachia pipientis]|uniref:hypothetical protein n=1 Tax=Wolbachia pipientis TaxID=955 RepID=UPI00397DC88C